MIDDCSGLMIDDCRLKESFFNQQSTIDNRQSTCASKSCYPKYFGIHTGERNFRLMIVD